VPTRDVGCNSGAGSLVGTVRGVGVAATTAASNPGRPGAQPPQPAPCLGAAATAAATASRSSRMGHRLRALPTSADPAAVRPRAASPQRLRPAPARPGPCHRRPDRHWQRRPAAGCPNRRRRPSGHRFPTAHFGEAAHGPPPQEAATLTPGTWVPGALWSFVDRDRAVPFGGPSESLGVTLGRRHCCLGSAPRSRWIRMTVAHAAAYGAEADGWGWTVPDVVPAEVVGLFVAGHVVRYRLLAGAVGGPHEPAGTCSTFRLPRPAPVTVPPVRHVPLRGSPRKATEVAPTGAELQRSAC